MSAPERMDDEAVAAALSGIRPELLTYVGRLVVRPELAEEIVQAAALRALEAQRRPADAAGLRPWLFTIATRLAIDELRRHGRWRQTAVADLRQAAEARPDFVAAAAALRGSPETAAIAREHLAVCFSCVLRNLPPREAAALLLREVHGFTLEETAGALGARPAQAKNWLQQARSAMEARYAETCALVKKNGVCYQCVELDGYFNGQQRNPLEGRTPGLDARLETLRQLAAAPLGSWHRRLLALLDEIG